MVGKTVKGHYLHICITEYNGIPCNGNRKVRVTALGHRISHPVTKNQWKTAYSRW